MQQIHLTEKLADLVSNRQLQILRQAMRAWRTGNAESVKQKRHAESHQMERLLIKVFTAWRQQAAIGVDQQKQLDSLAAQHLYFRKLQCSLQGFRAHLSHCHKIERLLEMEQQVKEERAKV